MENNVKATGFYSAIVSICITIGAMISYMVMSGDGENSPVTVYIILAASIVVQIITFMFNRSTFGNKYYNTSSIVSAVLIMVSLITMFMGRMEWLGGIAAHNANFAPLHTSFFVTIIMLIAGVVVSVFGCYRRQYK